MLFWTFYSLKNPEYKMYDGLHKNITQHNIDDNKKC